MKLGKTGKTVFRYAVKAGIITLFYLYVDQPTLTKGPWYMFVELTAILFVADQLVSATIK